MATGRRQVIWAALVVAAAAVALSLLWDVPYIYTLIGFAAWTAVGHLITADDDLPGGWSNPDGTLPFPWKGLAIKFLVLSLLIAVAALIPGLRAIGGG